MINKILQGWKMILHDYRHWKMIIKYPYCAFDCAVFFSNLAQPPNSLEDYIKEYKQLDPDWEKNYYDGVDQRMNETDKLLEEADKLLEEVDEVLEQ